MFRPTHLKYAGAVVDEVVDKAQRLISDLFQERRERLCDKFPTFQLHLGGLRGIEQPADHNVADVLNEGLVDNSSLDPRDLRARAS